jgi:hypothetical protein
VREGACIGAATILQPWTLKLILNAAALAAASPTSLQALVECLLLQDQPSVCLLLQDLVQRCLHGGGGPSTCVCVFYYCRTYYKAVRVGGGGEWRTCAMRDDEPRPVWMSLPITH